MRERSAALRGLAGIVVATIFAGCSSNGGVYDPAHAVIVAGSRSTEGSEQVLYSFTGDNDGGDAATGLVFDGDGSLYGTTVTGGTSQCGTVFKLMPPASPPWQESVLHSFSCYSDGKNPHGGVSFDRCGNLDGTTVAGGSGGSCSSDGCGVLFQLTPQTENVLHDFTAGRDGFGPGGGVVFDPSGNIYGMTPDGGAHSEGTIYEAWRAGRQWHEKIIHAFTGGADGGVGSLGLLLRDAAGNLYGVAEIGGAHGAGTVFKLRATSKKRWKLTTLYAFKGSPIALRPTAVWLPMRPAIYLEPRTTAARRGWAASSSSRAVRTDATGSACSTVSKEAATEALRPLR
ncbi:MAG: choice-of-anchor tandem repeat GloVer-containing protein [Candidatus Cybelea sp.]